MTREEAIVKFRHVSCKLLRATGKGVLVGMMENLHDDHVIDVALIEAIESLERQVDEAKNA